MLDGFRFEVVHAGSAGFDAAQTLVASQYERHFGTCHHHVLPNSFNMYSGDQLVGCAGFAGAADAPLFLEQYLDLPIEQSLASGTTLERAAIVEIGGLAVRHKRYVLPLMMQLAPELLQRRFSMAVCTVTAPVRGCLDKLGIAATVLGAADPARLTTAGNWGRYYELEPQVMAGSIEAGVVAISQLLALFGARAA